MFPLLSPSSWFYYIIKMLGYYDIATQFLL